MRMVLVTATYLSAHASFPPSVDDIPVARVEVLSRARALRRAGVQDSLRGLGNHLEGDTKVVVRNLLEYVSKNVVVWLISGKFGAYVVAQLD